MNKIIVPSLMPCQLCGDIPQVRINEGIKYIPKDNPMYSFLISHECGGFTCNHISLFFQNKSTRRSCMETLKQSVKLYSKIWNERHSTKVEDGEGK